MPTITHGCLAIGAALPDRHGDPGDVIAYHDVTKMSTYARWSPDGRHIAFDVDTGHLCNGLGCVGTCELWVAPVGALDVQALEASGDAAHFTVEDRDGDEQQLGCDLLGWTD